VIHKYEGFISQFPDIYTLERASLREILSKWQGLGYNRRALFLKKLATIVVTRFKGKIPSSLEGLESLPGVGSATAHSVRVFAFNSPEVFIETNIRTVFIHHFFARRDNVRDSEILPLIEKTLDRENPRIWYYALMDYGVEIKKQFQNPSRRSKHYKKQTAFEGSNRQLRGAVVRILVEKRKIPLSTLFKNFPQEGARVKETLQELEIEGFITVGKRFVHLVH
jgi:A/G-specific adenine glycosylase